MNNAKGAGLKKKKNNNNKRLDADMGSAFCASQTHLSVSQIIPRSQTKLG